MRARLQKNVPLAPYTTMRVGGASDWFLSAEHEQDIQDALLLAQDEGLQVLILGNGSNVIVRDGGFEGLTVRIGEGMAALSRAGDGLRAGAGVPLPALARRAQSEGLSGLEFAQGIPGTVGGGVFMNAGAYDGTLGGRARTVRLLSRTGDVRAVPASDMAFGYRHTAAMERGDIVLGAEFALQPDDPKRIAERMEDFAHRRREKQPLQLPSAGSFFKRPEGHFAGALIEQAGLKGTSVGGAQVSTLHAGFIVNKGGASARDVLALMALVQSRVLEHSGVQLEPEVRIVGRDLP